jgi:hypothetical protein
MEVSLLRSSRLDFKPIYQYAAPIGGTKTKNENQKTENKTRNQKRGTRNLFLLPPPLECAVSVRFAGSCLGHIDLREEFKAG